jgi:replicative DNA helicase
MHTSIVTPPHSTEAEQSVLGSLLMDGETIIRVADVLKPDDFYEPAHADIYNAMLTIFHQHKPIDLLTVTTQLQDSERTNAVGGSAYIAELTTIAPTSANVDAYAKIVRDASIKRRIGGLGRKISAYSNDPKQSADDVLETAERAILDISRHRADCTSFDLADLREERFSYYAEVYAADDKAAFYGLTTGFPDLDRVLTGLPAGDLIVLAARPSMGKTAFALDIAQHVVNGLDKIVMFISLEMSKEQVADRIPAGALCVSTHDLKKGLIEEEHFKKMGQVFDRIRKERLYIDDDCDSTLANLRSKARRQQMEHGLDLLVVDYLQLIDVGGKVTPENRVQEVSKISRDLKRLARELKVPVIAVSQLSRNVESRADRRPQLADLRESGSIEQDADTVLMLYRDDYYDEDSDQPGITDVYVRKQRQGPTGRISVLFNKERMCHESLARERIDATLDR